MTHTETAEKLFAQKFQCSQAVLAAFAGEFGLTQKQALQIGACFGGGMCRGEVCGACTGALMVLGLKFGQYKINDPESKAAANKMTEKFLDMFRAENGSYICREILGCDLATKEGRRSAREKHLFTEICPRMVVSATEITGRLLAE